MQSLVRGFDSFSLLAIPFFILAGEIMNTGGLSKRIVGFARSFMGHIRGSLGYAAILSSMVFAGVSGSADADTSAIGSILLPMMDEEGYDRKVCTALIATSGCIGPIIPPSIPMILYGVTASVSISKLFLGGIIPGILVGVGLMTVWGFYVKKQRYGDSSDKFSWKTVWYHTKRAFFALLLPVIILGGIITGVVTPTESAVIAVAYAFVVSKFVYRELSLRELPRMLASTARSTAVIMMVCGAAMSVAYYITLAQVPKQLSELLLSISDNVLVIMLILSGPFAQYLDGKMAEKGLVNVAWYEDGFRHLTNSKQAVTSPADVKGMKIRTMENPIHLAAWKVLGANPTPMAYTDVFTALQQHVIDGQENPFPTIYDGKFYEVQKYMSTTGHVYSPFIFVYSSQLFEKLPAEDQAIFKEVAKATEPVNREINRADAQSCREKMEAAGMEVTDLTMEQKQVFQDLLTPIWGDFTDVFGEEALAKLQEELAKL